MEEFLNSKTMLTPGVAGGITTLITASMSSQFNFPGKWTGLVVSFLFGSFIAYADADKALRAWQRVIFCILNTLIIFSIAVGANTAGVAATKPPESKNITERFPEAEAGRFFHEWF